MHLDLAHYPKGYTFGPITSEALGVYVKLADFTDHKGTAMFRMLIDPEIYASALEKLMGLTITDGKRTYRFYLIESVQAPVIDSVSQRSKSTTYLRATFLGGKTC
jgi:hypothetical protein